MLTDARCTPKHPGRNLSPPRQATPVLLALALAVWVAAVRGPFLGTAPINHDDAVYWVIGDAWRHGAPPYTRFWDLKPPGLFLLYRVAATVFGARPEGIRIIAMIAVWVTSLAIWRLGEVRFRDRAAGLVAAALYVPYTVVWYGLASEPELFIAPLVAASLALTLEALSPEARQVRLRLFGTGLLMGAAMTLKQTAALEALLVVAVIATIGRRSDWLAAFVAGAAAPPLAFLASFAAIGQAPALVSAVVVSALRRVGGDTPLAEAPAQFAILLWPGAPLVIGALLAWTERRALSTRGPIILLWAWIAVEVVGILAMHATYQYYYQPLVAPLSLLTGLAAMQLWRTGQRTARLAGMALLAVAAGFPAWWFPRTGEAILSAARTPAEMAHWLAQQHRGAGGSLYVVDYQPVVYQLSGLSPATRRPLPMQLVCPFPASGEPPEREIRRTMAQRPDFIVVSASRAVLTCEIPRLASLPLQLGGPDYRLARRFRDEMMGTIEVWQRTGTGRTPDAQPATLDGGRH